jgi:hypothetical protein
MNNNKMGIPGMPTNVKWCPRCLKRVSTCYIRSRVEANGRRKRQWDPVIQNGNRMYWCRECRASTFLVLNQFERVLRNE